MIDCSTLSFQILELCPPSFKNVLMNSLTFYLNGSFRVLNDFEPAQCFSSWLEGNSLKGTKVSCEEGGCGACTVLQSYYDAIEGKIIHRPVLACLLPLAATHGTYITTIEGLGSTKTSVHPIQAKIAEHHGSQCGMCSPGLSMYLYAFFLNNPNPSIQDIEESLSGAPNLCRCTGYRPIMDAAKALVNEKCLDNCNSLKFEFPTDLINFDRSCAFEFDHCKWYAPSTLFQLLSIKKQHEKSAIIVGGNTDLGVDKNLKGKSAPVLLYPSGISELIAFKLENDYCFIGSGVTISKMADSIRNISHLPSYSTRSLHSLANQTDHFASNVLRSIATIGGSVVTSSPVGDLLPVFIALNSRFIVGKINENDEIVTRSVAADNWIVKYRTCCLEPSEVLIGVEVPLTKRHEFTRSFKISKRKEDDISLVNSGMRISLNHSSDNGMTIADVALVIGGMSSYPHRHPETEAFLKDKPFSLDTLSSTLPIFAEEVKSSISARKMIPFKLTMCGQFLVDFFTDILTQYNTPDSNNIINTSYRPTRSSQSYKETGTIAGASRPHLAAYTHTTGEAEFSITMEVPKDTLEIAIVQAPIAAGRLISIDFSKALELSGVKHVITAKDLKFEKKFGAVIHDEDILADEFIVYKGQPVALILATSRSVAYEAARLVKVHCEASTPIVSIDDAIQQGKFLTDEKFLVEGDLEEAKRKSEVIIEGEIRIKEQEHFYLETNNVVIIPGEEIQVHASTQNPTETQHCVSNVLGLPFHRVLVKVRRLGGAFGGKETALLYPSLAAAAVSVSNKPVRLALTRAEDMVISGKRHPFTAKYKAGFTREGKLMYRDVELYSNGGCSLDLSMAILERALFHADGVYKAEASRVRGRVCFTNRPSYTAFRGFGAPQGLLIAEDIMARASIELGIDETRLKEMNFYQENDITHFKMKIENNNIKSSWDLCKEKSEFNKRRKEIELYNLTNPVFKRGIALQCMKFGISFTKTFMNKAAALVHCYTDGSVYVSHGGVEMGQGLHTRVAQVAAETLGVAVENVHVTETATDKVANTSPTAASTGADLNCKAVQLACLQILQHMAPLKAKHPNKDFAELCRLAFFERIPTSAVGYYATPGISFDWDKVHEDPGTPFFYFTFGTACVESEINTKTGEVSILRTDIVMDAGNSINPALDVGQIEGGFTQGMGWMTMEEIIRNADGSVSNYGPGTYKMPTFHDIPRELNVTLMENVPNPKVIRFSKGIGEPPFCFGIAVYMSIKEAVNVYRKSCNLEVLPNFTFPASINRIRNACPDSVSKVMLSVLDDQTEVDYQ
ncbi:hypothetical protein RCL1_005208 [Eukaryota sp. TZLM3-RCL]